ncbi:hypothetical protein FJ959_08765 [Mesorhizobium sp. B2-2-4]|uniref:hypothetical protein n=1 Tax=unclassified Mesorhizobium TaxID=325217 RepID=UPI00112DA5E5|nr:MULTISPECIES: hypothetical protein [unclassified Mesorhizobium]TPM58956.1 hypothetical protein FJ959_08765 [Mesorhizobium sp. B2-2-4]TPM67441.1 hypothetical protein FJ965_09905 [Mesorhizobium sp. B2-2-1]
MTPILVRDLLMNMLLGLTALVVLVLAQINPPAKEADSAKPPGQMMVCASWLGHDDIDLWFRPAGQEKATGYSNKNGGVADLLLDDLGTENIPHVECQFASSLPDGLWVINLHGYSVPDASVPVHVVARMGTVKLVETNLDIRLKQERTVVQFRLAGGAVVSGSENQVYVPLRSASK